MINSVLSGLLPLLPLLPKKINTHVVWYWSVTGGNDFKSRARTRLIKVGNMGNMGNGRCGGIIIIISKLLFKKQIDSGKPASAPLEKALPEALPEVKSGNIVDS